METSRNKFTNIICVLFSISLALLVCFSIGIRFGIANMVSRAIIAAIYCGIVVGLAFALNKVVNKALEKGVKLEVDKIFTISLVVDFIAFIVMRLLVIGDIIKVDFHKSYIFDLAKIGDDSSVYLGFDSIDHVFATILSLMFKLFGNTFFPVFLVQFVLSLISFILILVSINKIFGRIPCVLTGIFVSFMPVFYESIASDRADNLIFLMFAILLVLTSKYKDVIEEDKINVGLSLLIGLLSGLFALYSVLIASIIIIPIVVLWNCRREYIKDRVINTFVMVVGHVVSFGAGLLIDSYLFNKTGVIGFADSLVDHLNFRFSFGINASYIHAMAEDTGVFLLFVLAIIYCVLYWKNEDDVANIATFTATVFVIQLYAFGANNFYAAAMILAVLLMIIAGCGIDNLGYTEAVRVYRIDDDMQPAIVESIDDKPISETKIITENKIDNNIKTMEVSNVLDSVTSIDNSSNTVSNNDLETTEINNNISNEIESSMTDINCSLNDVENSSTETIDSDITEEVSVSSDTYMKTEEIASNNDEETSGESKYNEPEVRKSSDYGINNADFESLFTGTSNLPKFVYNDIYTDDLEIDGEDILDESDDVIDDETKVSDEMISEEINESENIAEDKSEEKDDSKDKKAYVDSFFGYLYGEEDGKFEAFEPLKPLDDIVEEKEPVVEEYVSHADKFADLDLDLGVDAFDNVIVEDVSKDVENDNIGNVENISVENVSVEGVNAEDVNVEDVKNDNIEDTESINIEYAETDNVENITNVILEENNEHEEFVIDEINSNESVMEDDEFFFDDVDNYVVEETHIEESMIQTDALDDDDISLEEILQKKIDEDFSYEDALARKIENEEIEKEIGFSFEQALEKKLDVEESINNALLGEQLSLEEILNDKIIVEDAVEEAVEDDNISVVHTLSNKIKIEEIIDSNISESFSIQEAIETKIDVEKSIENATNEKMLEEFGDDELFDGISLDFSGESVNISEELVDDAKNSDEYIGEADNSDEYVDEADNSDEYVGEADNSDEYIGEADNSDEYIGEADNSDEYVDEVDRLENLDNEDGISEELSDETDDPAVNLIQQNLSDTKSDNIEKPDVDDNIQFIENPLPLPKKHVHREMDYGRVIPSAWMHYDVELDNKNNHYDI